MVTKVHFAVEVKLDVSQQVRVQIIGAHGQTQA